MKQCVNEVVAFGMNDIEVRIVATVAAIAAIVYLFRLIHKYS